MNDERNERTCGCQVCECFNPIEPSAYLCGECEPEDENTECGKPQIVGTLERLGFGRVGTGGNCEAAERKLSDGFYMLVTDGEAAFPTDEDEALYVGVYTEEHGEALFWKDGVNPENLAAAVDDLKKAWLFSMPDAVGIDRNKGTR